MKKKIKIYSTILFVIICYSMFFLDKFYGFEYEDSFINPSIALSDNYFEKIENFRTTEYSKIINGVGYDQMSYTGHYMPYSFYLHLIQVFFQTKPYLIHKIANFILLIISVSLILLHRRKTLDLKIFITISLLSTLPFIYIINSALIENISFFFGILFITWIRYYIMKDNKINNKTIAVMLIALLSIIKRENLIYLLLIPVFIDLNDLKNNKIIFSFTFFILIQFIINPFYTEFLESESIKRPTFDIEYLIFQLPTYFKSLFSIKGFLPIICLLIFIKFNKKSSYLLLVWISFIVFYSIHYRSRYAVESKEINVFDTYRYLVNTLPIFYGVLIFSTTRNFKDHLKTLKYSYVLIVAFCFYNSTLIFKDFVEDEYINYHKVNDQLILKSKKEKLLIYDNFILISILNLNKQNIDIYELYDLKNIIKTKNTYIINRFNDFEMKNIKNLVPVEELSNNETLVYKFK